MLQVIVTSEQIARQAVLAIREKKGQNITILNLKQVKGAVTDYFILCTATSDRQAQAIADNVSKILRETLNEKPNRTEGYQKGEWILMDYFDVVIHIFQKSARDFYRLEELWGDGLQEDWQ
ncbi:MAG: ribosome silencing factor [Bacteroidia bacterium]|nr:ribosome silencing factor [Bacteroidia bacterium]